MIKGSIVALITPFYNNGKINFNKMKELIDYHIQNKTDGIVLFGTTGEGSTISFKEKYRILKRCIKYVKGRIPLIINCGSNSTLDTVYNCRMFSKLKPYALLIITPYYNKSNDEGMYSHFALIQEISKVPIIIYNVPSRTNYDLPLSVIKKLSQLKNIIGIKEASTDIKKLQELSNLQNENFFWYSGNDNRMIEDIKLGAKGLVGVVSNSHPKEIKNIIDSSLNGNYEIANYNFSKFRKYISSLNLEVNPIPIKEAMNILGFNVGGYRLPLHQMNKDNKKILLKRIGELNK